MAHTAAELQHAHPLSGTAAHHLPRRQHSRPFQSAARRSRTTRPATNADVEGSPASTVKLGRSDLEVSRLGIGTIRWGDTSKGFGASFDTDQLYRAYEAARVGGVNFFDTAEVYGYQSMKVGSQAEQLLGGFVRQGASLPIEGPPPIIASKYFTIPVLDASCVRAPASRWRGRFLRLQEWTNLLIGGGLRVGRPAMLRALRATLERLGAERLDLWQIHFPFPSYPQATLAEGLTEAYEAGLVRAVGVCNYNASQVEEMHGLLAKHNIPLASNQVKYSVLDRTPERDGTVAKCRELGVSVIAHSPLEQGVLTSRPLDEPGFGGKQAEQAQSLLKMMQLIGALSGGRTITQVALNWLMAKGAIPIPGARNAEQAKEQVGALGWSLDDNEVAMIEEKLDALKP